MEPQNTSAGHSDLEQGEQILWHHFFLFQSILQTHSNPNYVVLVLKRHKGQVEQSIEPRVDLSIQSEQIFHKNTKNRQWRKKSLFKKWYWENWISTFKTIKLYTSYSKQKSTLNGLRFNVKTQNHKVRRKHIKKLFDIVFNNDSFLDKTSKILTRASGITSN